MILFNEPNHATEWGGSVDSNSFAEVNKEFAKKIKESNKDFVIMMGGLDAAAPSQLPNFQDSGIFLNQVIDSIGIDEFNRLFDAWSSHAYPNPGFVGSPYASGKSTIKGYEWELNFLKQRGVKDLPVFITETGWQGNTLGRNKVAENFQIAFQKVWEKDTRIRAVTPFVLIYQSAPFLQFSWLQKDSNAPNPEYTLVQSLPKTAGQPDIIQGGEIMHNFPTELVEQSTFRFQFTLKNTGQAIWKPEEYTLSLEGVDPKRYLVSNFPTVKPGETKEGEIFFISGAEFGAKKATLILSSDATPIVNSKVWQYKIVPLPSLQIQVTTFPKFRTNGENFEVQIFDDREQLIFKQKNIKIDRGNGGIAKVENIALHKKYRVVILKKYYLPTQSYIEFTKGENKLKFKSMLPVDANDDGNVSWDDLSSLFTHPALWSQWLPW